MEIQQKNITLKKIIITRLIFIVIFSIIASLITYYFISEKNKNSNISESIKKNINSETIKRNHIGLIDYDNDTFNYNNLLINEIKENYEGYDISYFQIDGLKNTDIQDKINRNLNYDLKTKITELKNNGNIKGDFYVYSSDPSSFENTISIRKI